MTFSTTLESRTYFRSLDGALADFGLALGAVDKVRDAVRGLDYEHVYIPNSREYIALEPADAPDPVAYITPAFVALHPRGCASSFVELPQPEPRVRAEAQPARASAGRRATTKRPAEPALATCPTCFTGLPLSGSCDWCG